MTDATTIEVPQDVLDSARITPSELKVEMAVWLYAQGRLSVGKARQLAGMPLGEFRQVLASRQIAAHLSEKDVDQDLAALHDLRAE